MKLDPFSRQVQVFLQDLKSPQARSARLAKVADQGIAEIRAANAAATGGKDIEPEITVDGRPGAPLGSVRPDGVIVAQFDPLKSVLDWIGEQLVLESPRLYGRYERSHVLLIDGIEFDPDGALPSGELFRFVNKQPYAAKIEPFGRRAAQSDQAPEGVYMVVAAVAARRFGNIAKVSYSRAFFDEQTGYMHPSIVVRPF